MTRSVFPLTVCLLGVLPLVVCGFSTLPAAVLDRSFNQKVSLTNSPLQVTVVFTNLATNELRGFFFTEQVPSSLVVSSLAVTLNGRPVTNYIFETGSDGDVLPGCTPWRWGFETPTNFVESNPIPGRAGAQIVYALSCSSTGTFSLPLSSWAATATNPTNTSFGYSENSDQRSVRFVTRTNLPLIAAQPAADNYTVTVDGAPDSLYLLSASTNLVTWVPVATNLSPFVFFDTNRNAFPRRFYRAAPYTGISATFQLARSPAQGFLVRVFGVPGCNYVLERSTNLFDWFPVATNLPPYTFIDTNTAGLPACFYRGRLRYTP